MTLTDTGPLVALLDKADDYHAVCLSAAGKLPSGALLTTWPCFTEAMYLLGAVGGWHYQRELWRLLTSERLVLHELTPEEIERMSNLMAKYNDTPMDLADASLVVVAESLMLTEIFAVDSDFLIYRLGDGSALQIIR